jgi:acetyl-CoA C-acetyltransferase
VDPRAPVVVAARRTPVATAGRALAELDAAALAAPVLGALRADAARLEAPVDDVVLGNCCGPGGNVARVAALAAELGPSVPGVTVDRQCGAGLEAVRLGAALVRSGEARLLLAGGTESATHARDGGARAPFAPPGWPDPDMGEAAEALAASAGVHRSRQDGYAARSHRLAVAAADAGVFDPELVAVAGSRHDDRPRRRLGEEVLARMPGAFMPGGSVTAGNSCGINDGAAALALVPAADADGLAGLRVVASAVAGVDPALPGLGPVPAVRAVLGRAGIPLDAVDVVEITEAFAAQVLACADALGLDPLGADAARVCPEGGAIALGHPWGASGALLVVRLFSSLVRRRLGRYGLAACAVGGGQGVALLVEAVDGELLGSAAP